MTDEEIVKLIADSEAAEAARVAAEAAEVARVAAEAAEAAEAARVAAEAAEAARVAAEAAAKPVRVITQDVILSAGLRNGMTPEQVDEAIEAVFTRRGE